MRDQRYATRRAARNLNIGFDGAGGAGDQQVLGCKDEGGRINGTLEAE
jgi:hypothetical protein